jgi:adenylate cyclase
MSATMIIIFILSAYQFESRKKNYLRDAFSQYVPPEYLKLLLNNPDAYGLDGRTLELTVLFADIRDFTRLSEPLDAAGVKKILNTFLTPMTKTILRNKGTIDKYFGDMVMAFWGAPIENLRHNEWALNAAIAMIEKTISLKPIFRLHNLPEIDIGIGLNSGLMNVGDMGSEFRRSYTVIGDAVNLGARLQSATKYYGVKIIAGRATVINQTKFIYRLIDKCLVKGKSEIIEVFEVICRTSALTQELALELKEHSNALNAYFAKDFDLALKLFQALSNTYPDSCLYKVFLNRILDFKKNKPEPDWNGAFELKDK